MRFFTCASCGQRLYFENHRCLGCGRELGFLPESLCLVALDPAGTDLHAPVGEAGGTVYRKCSNYVHYQVCNWLVPAWSDKSLCRACELTRVIPDLSCEPNRLKWGLLETAKRRLVYSLLRLGLPVVSQVDDPRWGMAFRFLDTSGAAGVVTGHLEGTITISLTEADSVHRERARQELAEPYRTLLGHLRHESGHYYWERLVAGSSWLEGFRSLFGDERRDYSAALAAHYGRSLQAWQGLYISGYASAHPWEDWAECWAHYLHLRDCLETAVAFGLCPAFEPTFEGSLRAWLRVSEAVNALNRSMGLPDLYPFVLSDPVTEKLRFVHDLIASVAGALSFPS